MMPALPAGGALVGLAGGELEGMMGEPTLIRADGNAQYWRYSLGGCQLDLFLYADGGRPRVAYLDVRPSRGIARDAASELRRAGRRLRGAGPLRRRRAAGSASRSESASVRPCRIASPPAPATLRPA